MGWFSQQSQFRALHGGIRCETSLREHALGNLPHGGGAPTPEKAGDGCATNRRGVMNLWVYGSRDLVPEAARPHGITSISDVLHPDLTSTENKNSTSNLIRRKSFTARNRTVANGRQWLLLTLI